MQQIIETYGQLLLAAMGKTLTLALCGLFFACLIGLLFGILSVLKNKVCNAIYRVFVDVIRGVPMIVLAYFVYFGVPYIINKSPNISFTLSALQAGTVCLSLNCGAYMRKVVLPQAIRTMIPSIINQFIITLKDTSILSVIGFPELVNTSKNVVANTGSVFEVWGVVAVMYLIIITLLSYAAKMLERRLNRGRKL